MQSSCDKFFYELLRSTFIHIHSVLAQNRHSEDEIAEDAAVLEALKKEKSEHDMSVIEKICMKDIWNKCTGWIDLTGEFLVEGLIMRCPDLTTVFGKTESELLFHMMVSIIDKSVRSLDERTEVIARETYHCLPLQPSIDAPFHTLEEGYKQFAQLGMRPSHWKEARALFVIAMQKANPYLSFDAAFQ